MGLLNSIMMQVMLSAPRPSEVAKFEGRILSIMSSTILETTTYLGLLAGVLLEEVLVEAALKELPLFSFYWGVLPILVRCRPGFLVGDTTLFLPAEDYTVVAADLSLLGLCEGLIDYLLRSFYLVS